MTKPAPGHLGPGRVRRRWRPTVIHIASALLVWIGLLVFSYPEVAAWISQYNQSRIVADYSEAIDDSKPGRLEQLAAADEYNSALSAGAVLEAGANIAVGNGTLAEGITSYYQQLSAFPGAPMARLKIPSIDLDLPVYHGTSDETLLRGLGHLEGTSLPVGGLGTKSVITGHRGLASATMFTNLDGVKVGDKFVVEVFQEVLTYRVVESRVVEPDETAALLPEPGRDLFTLVTCTPLGINTHRILVTGERVTPTPQVDVESAGADPTLPHFPWWAVTVSAGTLLVAMYLWRGGYEPSRPKRGRVSRV